MRWTETRRWRDASVENAEFRERNEIDRLADLDNVVAIKESSGDWTNFHDTLVRVHDRIRVFCGPSSVFGVAAVLAGADGHIDCFPNVWTGCFDLWHASKAGRMREAWALRRGWPPVNFPSCRLMRSPWCRGKSNRHGDWLQRTG